MFGGLARLLGRGIEELTGGQKRNPREAGVPARQPIQPIAQAQQMKMLPRYGEPQTDMQMNSPYQPRNNQSQLDLYTRNNINTGIGGMMSGIGDNGGVSRDMGWADGQMHNPWEISPQAVAPTLDYQTKKSIRRNFLDY